MGTHGSNEDSQTLIKENFSVLQVGFRIGLDGMRNFGHTAGGMIWCIRRVRRQQICFALSNFFSRKEESKENGNLTDGS